MCVLCLGGGGSAVDKVCDRMAVACPCVGMGGTVNVSSPHSANAVGVAGSGLAGTHLPDTRLLAVYHRHVAGLAIFDELLLGLIELLGHEAHEGVVWGVSYSPAAKGEEGVIEHPSRGPLTCLSQESQLSRWGERTWVGCLD